MSERLIIGNAGLYFACYQLSCMGWNVMPTSRNARGIDIIAYSTNGLRFVKLQVKALSKRNPVPVGASLDNIMGDYWIIVINVVKEPCAFIMHTSEVLGGIHRGEKNGKVSHWLEIAAYDKDDYRNKWDRIGHGDNAPVEECEVE